MNHRIIHQLSDAHVEQLLALYRGEWWCRTRNLNDVHTMLKNCYLVVGIEEAESGELLAFTRVLSDGVYKAIMFDVIVRPDQRGKGLGDSLMKTIVEHPALRQVETLELYCLPDMLDFYKRWGFSTDIAGCLFLRRKRPE